MILDWKFSRTVKAFFTRTIRHRTRRMTRLIMAFVTAVALGLLALVISLNAHASAPTSFPLWGTLDTQTSTAATEGKAGVMAMFEYNWASFEPTQGVLSSSYLATMKSELAAYQAAGQKVTLGLGLQNPPSWVFNLADSRYVDQTGSHFFRGQLRVQPGGPLRGRVLPVPGGRRHPAVELLGHPADLRR